MKKVYIVGYNGNMARRYRACLDYLGVKHCGEDLYDDPTGTVADCDGIIIATPTITHLRLLNEFGDYNKPILIEKPISLKPFKLLKANIQMVNQYAFCGPFPGDETYYNCWNTGKDGLAWDCINIIGLSQTMPEIRNDSPIWKCTLNGKELTLNDIDNSYIKMLDSWTRNPKSNIDYIHKAHEKVREYVKANQHCHPSQID